MGYGVRPPGFWSGRTELFWKTVEGQPNTTLINAFAIWRQKVGMLFTEVIAGNTVAIDFQVKNGGSAALWSLDKGTLFLKGNEPLGIVLHEVGHMLGLSHEHDRPDVRDTWYTANPGHFGKAESMRQAVIREANLRPYGSIDTASIMHYPDTHYKVMTEPSLGDIQTVRMINGWAPLNG